MMALAALLSSSVSSLVLVPGDVAPSSASDVSMRCVSCGQPEVLNHLFFCAGLSPLKEKWPVECRAALSAIALPGEEPTRNLELICDSVNARDDASAAVALDLFLGSGRIGAVVLSKKEALRRRSASGQCFVLLSLVRGWCVH